MTTDKTPATLATVKHGGCVQVMPSDAARNFLAAQYRDDGDKAKAIRINHKSLTDSDRRAMRAIEAALSAQPSPGGQGDAREQFEEYRGGDCERDAQGYYTNPRTAQDWAMWQAALAARQPVGNEPAFYLSAGAWGHIRVPMTPTRDVKAFRHGFDHGDTELVPFYAAPPVQSAGEPMEMRICELRHVSLKPNRPYVFTIDANCANCRADAAYAMGHTDTKPAQAVDLAAFKALYRAYVRLLESGRDRIIDLGGTCDPVDVMEANDVDLQAARRFLDSQAVGK